MPFERCSDQEWRLPNGDVIRVRLHGAEEEWFRNGKYHRVDGPALVRSNHYLWFIDGKMHRTDGPAFITNDYIEWFIDGVKYTFNDWLEQIAATPEEKTMLRLKWAK